MDPRRLSAPALMGLRASLLVFAVVAMLAGAPARAQVTWPTSEHTLGEVTDLIRHLASIAPSAGIDDEPLFSAGTLQRFYRQRDFRPAWIDRNGVSIETADMLERLRHADIEGVDPARLHVPAIEARLARADDVVQLAQLDVLLSDAFLTYSRHVRAGLVLPNASEHEWRIPLEKFDFVAALESASRSRTAVAAIDDMSPPHEGYKRLRVALTKHLAIQRRSGWLSIPDGKRTLKKGVRDERVPLLRAHFVVLGDLRDEPVADERLFDSALDKAVRRFQQRHGIETDGVVGAGTRAALNVPVTERIRQIQINMERWRWLPRTLPRRHLAVNMAGFELAVMEDGLPISESRVIVGRDQRQTPVMASRITSVVINPYWYVPQTVLHEDLLPALQKDTALLQRLNLRVFADLKGQGKEVDAAKVDWKRYTDTPFPYTLRQEPGPANALGNLKFILEDSPAIYLHDTANRGLFQQRSRALSSGCIRVEDPAALAEYVLGGDWPRQRLDAAIESRKSQQVEVSEPLPIYLLYFTVWVNELNELNFRDDVYGRDQRLSDAMTTAVAATR